MTSSGVDDEKGSFPVVAFAMVEAHQVSHCTYTRGFLPCISNVAVVWKGATLLASVFTANSPLHLIGFIDFLLGVVLVAILVLAQPIPL